MLIRTSTRSWRVHVLLLAVACVAGAGCFEHDGIRSYTVENVSQAPAAGAVDPVVPGAAWFFKLQGPPESVLAQGEAFAGLLATVSFAPDGSPNWTNPAGWSTGPADRFRYATLTLDGSDPPLEIAISTLPADEPGSDEYLKLNIDRWRGQIGLPPGDPANWKQAAAEAGELQESESNGQRVVLVQMTGADPSGDPSAILAAILPRPGASPVTPARPATTTAPPQAEMRPPTYSVPPEWAEQAAGQFQMALWTVRDGDQQVDISLSLAGGSAEDNLARWAGQVGLTSAALPTASRPVQIAGRDAMQVELVGGEKTILGVIIPEERAQASWFVKLIGPNDLAARERERFQQFTESIKF